MSTADGTTGTMVDASELTFDKIMRARQLVDELVPRFDSLFAAKGGAIVGKLRAEPPYLVGETFCGLQMRVHEIPAARCYRPALQISPSFPHCSAEFRAQWNAWALERFGVEEVAYVMDTRVLAQIQANIDARVSDVLRGVNPRSVVRVTL